MTTTNDSPTTDVTSSEVGNGEKDNNKNNNSNGSKVFRRNRALGFVSNGVPAVVRYVQKRKDNLVTTCIGRSFQVYSASHFRLLHVSSQLPDEITALAIDRFHTFTASNKCVYAWRAGKHIRHVYRGHTRNVHLLLPFARHLVAIDEANVMRVWDIASEQVYLEVPYSAEEFLVSALAHPPTYLNKIVLGSAQGQLKIVNLKDNRLIHTFAGRGSRVTSIQPAPALDVVAAGHQDGCVVLLNLKFDEVLMSFQQDWGPVTQIAFRTDGPPILATASNSGNIAFWNLEERKIATQVLAHEDSVTTAVCFANEPLLLTTSPDNSMKLWIFDMPDGGARTLRLREGHTAPPLCIRFHGSNGKSILSAGEDSALRVFSTISESLSKSMGKASYNRKASKKKNRFQVDTLRMPPIVEFTSETTREKEWDNIAAIHSGVIQTTTWSFHKNRMGEHRLVPKQFQNKHRTDFESETTCLTLTHCGNFVIIGYSSGDVERFNIQSGLHRATYGQPAHKAAVRGVSSDNLNQFLVSGCSDGLLKFWPFKGNATNSPNAIIKFSDGIALMRNHRESAMIAVALESFVICIVDGDTKALVRKFAGHTAKINDITFSPDSRWLLTAAMDSTIKVWDIPSSYMIDHFRVERPCVSLTMSPTGDFLATAHVNHLGLYLWSNKTLFSQLSLRSINPFDEAPYVGLPANLADELTLEDAVNQMDIVDDDLLEGEEIELKYETPAQLSAELITMSGLAASRWQNLLDLALIKKRNKPRAPPKVPKQAPFFLPTVAGLEMKFDLSAAAANGGSGVEGDSKVRRVNALSTLTAFGQLLEASIPTTADATENNDNYEKCVAHLKQLGPSMLDFEFKSLHPLGGGSHRVMVQFLRTIEYMFVSCVNFELAQSYLSSFLRAHGSSLLEAPGIVVAMKSVSAAQERCWEQLEEKLMFGMGVVSALRNFVH